MRMLFNNGAVLVYGEFNYAEPWASAPTYLPRKELKRPISWVKN